MEPDAAPAPVDPQVGTTMADITAFEASPAQLAANTAVNLGLVLLPLLVLMTALVKLRRGPEHRTLHAGLALAAGLAVLLSAVTIVVPGAIPDGLRDGGVLSFTWVFLFAWMTLDFIRSARRTGLRPRVTDVAVLFCAGATLAGFAAQVAL
ncbi:hypothetical protein HKCCSP123_06705 [Rhodobacterales bacterium HKCCSP123]|nr:hypothetical protein [Rhodobacterales bacterium HKCCSP123]